MPTLRTVLFVLLALGTVVGCRKAPFDDGHVKHQVTGLGCQRRDSVSVDKMDGPAIAVVMD